MPDHLPKSISEKPLHTLRFYQMRISLLLGSVLFLAYIYAPNHNVIFLVLLLFAVGHTGSDFTNILMHKRGVKSAPPLIYKVGSNAEYLRIIKAIVGYYLAWLFFLIVTFILAEDYQAMWLRVSAVLAFNIISITMIRWGQEVYKMLTDYTKAESDAYQKIYGKISVAPTPLSNNMRPFIPPNSGQAAPQPMQQSASIANRREAQPYLPVASLPATMQPFTPNDSGQAVPQQSVPIAIRKGAQP